MSQKTWPDTKGHHWFDKAARNEMPLIEAAYGDFTTPRTGAQHVIAHRDVRYYGRIGAIARFEINRIIEGDGFIMY